MTANNFYAVLHKCALFKDVSPDDIPTLLDCLSAKKKQFEKDASIFSLGSTVWQVGIVLSGSVRIEQTDFWGNRTIVSRLDPGDLFGEAFSCAEIERIPVQVSAGEQAEVLLVQYRKIIDTCSSACVFHARLIENMMRILARKNVALTQKLEIVSQRTTREKLLSFLSKEAGAQNSTSFEISFNRQELADFLSVDRSALSAELSRMQKDGLIRYRKNHFELL